LLALILLGCGPTDSPPPKPPPAPIATVPGAWIEAAGLPDVALPPNAPDIVLVVVDTWRADSVGSATPKLNAWSRGARHYSMAVAPSSWTLPSVAATLAGRELRANHKRVPDDWRLLAEVLHDAGYATHAVVANSALAQDSGIARGFDTYELSPLSAWDATEVLRRASARLAEPRTRPRFLYVHLMDPHLPYSGAEAPGRPGWSTGIDPATLWPGGAAHVACIERWRRRYDAEVSAVDSALAPWLSGLTDAIVALTSDHGEGLFSHTVDPKWLDKAHILPVVPGCGSELLPGYPDHGLHRYEEAIRVPLFVRAPGVLEGEVHRPVRLIDLSRTLLHLAGGSVDGPRLPLQPGDPHASLIMGTDKAGSFVRMDGFKLLRDRDGTEQLMMVGLTESLVPEGAAASVREDLGERLTRWQRGAVKAASPGPQTTEALKALGYIE
jgi:arylsulfatase A-like enzyme